MEKEGEEGKKNENVLGFRSLTTPKEKKFGLFSCLCFITLYSFSLVRRLGESLRSSHQRERRDAAHQTHRTRAVLKGTVSEIK